jgi:hypothetical protein
VTQVEKHIWRTDDVGRGWAGRCGHSWLSCKSGLVGRGRWRHLVNSIWYRGDGGLPDHTGCRALPVHPAALLPAEDRPRPLEAVAAQTLEIAGLFDWLGPCLAAAGHGDAPLQWRERGAGQRLAPACPLLPLAIVSTPAGGRAVSGIASPAEQTTHRACRQRARAAC